LKEKFRSAFATSKERPKTKAGLKLIRKGLEEPLKQPTTGSH